MSSLGSGRPSSVSQYHCKCGMPSSGATKQLWGPSLPANLFSPAGFAQSSFCAPPWLFSLKQSRPVHFPPLLYLWPFHCFHCASWNFLSVRRKCLWAYSETQPETPNWAGWSCGSINNWGKLYHRPCYVFCSKLFLWRSPLLQGYCGGYLWLSPVPKFGWGENCCPADVKRTWVYMGLGGTCESTTLSADSFVPCTLTIQ